MHHSPIRHYKIYALTSPDKQVYISKSYAHDLKSTYYNHVSGRCYLTADVFGKTPPKVLPELHVLETVSCTFRDAYKRVIAWSRYFEDCGYTLLVHTKTAIYSENLYSDTQTIYNQISRVPLEEILSNSNKSFTEYHEQLSTGVPKTKTPSKSSRLSIRLNDETKEAFSAFCEEQHLTQAEGFELILAQSIDFTHGQQGTRISEYLQKHHKYLEKAKEDNNKLRNIISRNADVYHSRRDNLNTEFKQQRLFIHAFAKHMITPDNNSMETLPVLRLKKLKQLVLNLEDYQYPATEGISEFYLHYLAIGEGKTAARFVFGEDESGNLIRLRFYAKNQFIGIDIFNSQYSFQRAHWLVSYRKSKDEAYDLYAALPIQKGKNTHPHSDLDFVIRDAESRL